MDQLSLHRKPGCKALMFFLLLLVIAGLFSCGHPQTDHRPVVICVIDDFSRDDSHGARVSRMVEEIGRLLGGWIRQTGATTESEPNESVALREDPE